MKEKHNAEKEITRSTRLEIRMSKEEKDLWFKYAEDMGVNPSRLARNILLMEAESILNKYYTKNVAKAYIKAKELLKDKDFLERIKKD